MLNILRFSHRHETVEGHENDLVVPINHENDGERRDEQLPDPIVVQAGEKRKTVGKEDDMASVPSKSKIQRFELEVDSRENDWELPENLLAYLNKYVDNKIPEKELRDKITNFNPVPKNVRKTQEIDIFIKDVLVENNKNSTLHVDRLLKATQEKVLQILGPLTRLWEITDREKIYVDEDVPEEVEQFQNMINLMEQSVLCTGQALNKIEFTRRYNVLNTLIENSPALVEKFFGKETFYRNVYCTEERELTRGEWK